MKAAIIAVGDELLIGQVVNTNAAWLGNQLTEAGVVVDSMTAIADRTEAIAAALREMLRTHDLLILTGGLGPTHDDITRDALADFFGRELLFHDDIFEEIVRRFEARGLPIAASNRSQAMVPAGFEPLHNPIGTAPGMWYEEVIGGAVRRLVVLPGVPPEMKVIFRDTVLPRLRSIGGLERIVRQTILTTGIGESNLNEKLGDLTPRLDEALALAFLPGLQGVRLRVTAFPDRDPAALERMSQLIGLIRERAGRNIYGEGEMTMESVVGELLKGRGRTIAVAESCTGGLVLSRLTDIPGASAYVLGGVVAYDDHVKRSALGVRPETLECHGAVSRETVVEMAEGVRKRLGADIGIATSGILGPDGGTDEKPVGTVWIAYSSDADGAELKLRLGKDRGINKERAATAVLDLTRRKLSGDSNDEAA